MKLLIEYTLPGSAEIEHYIKENKQTGEKDVILRGIFTEAEKVNKNKRIYGLKILEREMRKLNEKAQKDFLFGELDHPQTPDSSLANAAFRINKIWQNPNNPCQFLGEGKILKETEKGKTAYALSKEGFRFGISTRAVGSIEERDGVSYVGEDLNLISADLVSDPSSQDAYLKAFNEGVEYFIDAKTGYIKEDTAITLKNKLHSLPKAKIEEGVVEIYHTWLKETFGK